MLRLTERPRAEATTAAMLDKLSVSSIGELQSVPVEDLVAAQEAVVGGPLGGLYGDGPRLAPMLDGEVLRAHPFDPVASSACADVSLMIGSCKDEATMTLAVVPGIAELDPPRQVARLADEFFDHSFDDLMPCYASRYPDRSMTDHFLRIFSDQIRVGGITMAERKRANGEPAVYMYRVDYSPPIYDGKLGALHTVDIGFVFANTDAQAGIASSNRGLYQGGPEVARLTDEMSGAWLAFARTGDPNHRHIPTWPSYDSQRRATMVFDLETRVVEDPDGPDRLCWTEHIGGM
jgi:para-nitrobenzyl esterase